MTIGCVLIACTSCVGNPPVGRELPLPPERISRDGYSLLPPDEAGWDVVENDSRLLLVRRHEGRDKTFIIDAGLLKLPPYRTNEELRRLIDSVQLRSNEQGRLVTTMHEVEADAIKGVDCVKSRDIGETQVPVEKSGGTRNMIIEMTRLICAHPEDRAVGIEVSYSHIRFPTDIKYLRNQDSAFFDRAAAFLEDVEFNDL